MKIRQAVTGQPVWVMVPYEEGERNYEFIAHYRNDCGIFRIYVTNTPDWNIPNAEYSFTEFKEEV